MTSALTERELLIWQLGREYGHAEVADAIEEAQAVPVWLPVARPWEEQVSARLDEMGQWYYAMLDRTGRREWVGTSNGDDARDYYRHGQHEGTGATMFRSLADQNAANVVAGRRYKPLTYTDMWPTLDTDTKARIRADHWDDRAKRWIRGVPEVVRRG